jgi:hypothetical protein
MSTRCYDTDLNDLDRPVPARAHSIFIGLARIFPGTKVMVNGARARELAG